jgi:hypothetical protein
MTGRKVVAVLMASMLCVAGGWVGIVVYVAHAINENNQGWCDFIAAAQPRTQPEVPTSPYGQRLLIALNRRGSDIGCSGLPPVSLRS